MNVRTHGFAGASAPPCYFDDAVHIKACCGALAVLSVALTAGCGDVNTALKEVSEARRLAADLLVEFTKASDASNRAVMADTDETSTAFAHEAEQAADAVQRDAAALAPILATLRFSEEAGLLETFDSRFAQYRALDRQILDLAVENTNLKAQRLSFGAAQQAADLFQQSLEAVTPSDQAKDGWRLRTLAWTAVANAREIQALEAQHIAEAEDAQMTAIEERMGSAESAARGALKTMTGLAAPASREKLAAAAAALDKLMTVNMQIVDLSRRNSNVRSMALSLNQKRAATAACEESLVALRAALAKRGFTSTRGVR